MTAMANQPPRVTWLLPVRNGMPYLPRTLASLAAQTYARQTVIAWDNGSTDGTQDVLREWLGTKLPGQAVIDRPLGLGASLAAMVAMADTPYCARIDADDLAEPQRLAQQIALLDERRDMAVVGSAVQYIDAQDREIEAVPTLAVTDAEIRWRLRFCNALNHPTVTFRRAAILEAGNYRDVMPIEDYDLWVRVAAKHAMANLPRPLVRYRIHGGSVSAQNKGRIDAIRKRVAAEYAATLFPGIDVATVERLWALLDDAERMDVTLADCRAFSRTAKRAAKQAGIYPRAFCRTPLFRMQHRSLTRRWLKSQPIVGQIWQTMRRRAA